MNHRQRSPDKSHRLYCYGDEQGDMFNARSKRDPLQYLATRNNDLQNHGQTACPPIGNNIKHRKTISPRSSHRCHISRISRTKTESDEHHKTERARIQPQDISLQGRQNSREKTACTRTASMRSKSPILCCGVSALESSKPIDDTSSSSA